MTVAGTDVLVCELLLHIFVENLDWCLTTPNAGWAQFCKLVARKVNEYAIRENPGGKIPRRKDFNPKALPIDNDKEFYASSFFKEVENSPEVIEPVSLRRQEGRSSSRIAGSNKPSYAGQERTTKSWSQTKKKSNLDSTRSANVLAHVSFPVKVFTAKPRTDAFFQGESANLSKMRSNHKAIPTTNFGHVRYHRNDNHFVATEVEAGQILTVPDTEELRNFASNSEPPVQVSVYNGMICTEEVFNSYERLMEYFIEKVDDESLWSTVRNGVTLKNLARDVGRKSTYTNAMNENLLKTNIDLLEDRGNIDAFLSLTLFALGIADVESDDEGRPRLYFPDSGLKMMRTTQNCERQVGHTAFYFSLNHHSENDKMEELKYPPYFFLITYKSWTPIWILEHSHTDTGATFEEYKSLTNALKMKLRFVPPYSLFIGRGDLTHASGGTEDLIKNQPDSDPGCMRGHSCVVTKEALYPDSINTLTYNKNITFGYEETEGPYEKIKDVDQERLLTE